MEQHMNDGAAAFGQGRFQDAIAAYTAAIDTDPTAAKAWSNRSACFVKLEQYEEALRDAEEAIRADPLFSKAFGRKAVALQGLKRYEEAARAFGGALALDPHNASYQQEREAMVALVKQGRGVASKETKDRYYFEKSLREGKEAMTKGALHEAVRHFTRAIELSDNDHDTAVLLSNRSAAHYRLDRMKEARHDAEQSITKDPSYGRGHLRLAMALRNLNLLDEALLHARKCLSFDPDHSLAKEELASIEAAVTARDRSAAAAIAEQREKADEISGDRLRTGDGCQGLRRQAGPTYANTFVHCSFCNAQGHDRSECPVLRRKRARNT